MWCLGVGGLIVPAMINSTGPTLRQAARIALGEFGITRSRLTLLASRHNDVFRVRSSSGGQFVLRVQNDLLSDAEARSQIEWMESLIKHANITVPAPVRTLDGRPFTRLKTGSDNRRAVLLKWVPGRPARRRDETVYRSAVRMIAQLHNHAQTFRPSRGFACRQLDGDWLFGARFFVRATRSARHLDTSQRKVARAAERLVRNTMANLGHSKRRFGVIHADLNLDNIVFHCGNPSPTDFDEFGKCWFVFDLAELIRTSISSQNWQERKQLATSAYTEERKLDDAEIEAFDAFIVATFVQYLNWAFIHARNDDDLRWVGLCIEVIRKVTTY
jgi:Ser/Thr protein kinase RdoA (MazF antagonist)